MRLLFKFLGLGKIHTNRVSIWKKFTLDIPLLALLISAFLSAYGIFLLYENSNITLGYILAIGTIILGLIVTHTINDLIEGYNNDKYHNKKYVAIIGIIAIAWLSISPMFNAMTFNANSAIRAEAKEQLLNIEEYTSSYIEQDVLYKKIANIIKDSYHYLEREVEIQSMPANGGCKNICQDIQSLVSQIRPSYIDFNNLYPELPKDETEADLDEEEKLKYKTMGEKLQEELYALEIIVDDNSANISDILYTYTQTKNSISNTVLKISIQNNPLKKAKDILLLLESFQRNLQQIEATNRYAKITLDSIKTKIQNLENEIKQIEDKKINKVMIKKPSFPNITLDINLILKHASNYWSLMIFAFFIDILAFILLLLPLISSNNAKRLKEIMQELLILEKRKKRYKEEKEIFENNQSSHDREINRLEQLIDYEEDDNIKKINKKEKDTKEELKVLNSNLKSIQDDCSKEMLLIAKECDLELRKKSLNVTDYENIDKKYTIIKSNMRDNYNIQINQIQNAIKLLEDELHNIPNELDKLIKADPEIIIFTKELEEEKIKKQERLCKLKIDISELKEIIIQLNEEIDMIKDVQEKEND